MRMVKVVSSLTLGVLICFSIFYNITESVDVRDNAPNRGQQLLNIRTNGTGRIPADFDPRWNEWKGGLRRNSSLLDSFMEVGPSNISGRIRALLIDRLDTNHLIAGGASGGLWQSFNNGLVWEPINDLLPSLMISCIAQSESNPKVIYVGTGEPGGSATNIGGIGVFKSINGGKSFFHLKGTGNGFFKRIWDIEVDPRNDSVVYVLPATNKKGVYRSKDGGKSWAGEFRTTYHFNDIEIFPDGSLIIAGPQGVFKSPTGDYKTYNHLMGNFGVDVPKGATRYAVSYCDSFPNVIYLAAAANNRIVGFYRSGNGGLTWQKRITPEYLDAYYAWYCLAMKCHSSDSNKVILGSVSIFHTANGGYSWIAAYNTHADYHTIETNPQNANQLIIGNDGGAYFYSWDDLRKPESIRQGLNVTQFYHGGYSPRGKNLIGGTQDNGTLISYDLEPRFDYLLGADGGFSYWHQQNDSIIYASQQRGIIYRLERGNGFWRKELILNNLDSDGNMMPDEGVQFINPYYMNYLSGDQLFYVTNKGVWRSKNRGDNWEKITNHIPALYAIGLSAEENPQLYAGGQSRLHLVKDAGSVNPGDNSINISGVGNIDQNYVSALKVHPLNKDKVYVGFGNYASTSRLHLMEKVGSTYKWSSIGHKLPQGLPINWIEVDDKRPDKVIFVGTDYGLYFTQDGGESWSKDLNVPNVPVNTVLLRSSDRKLFIFTHGRGAFVAHLDDIDSLPHRKKSVSFDSLTVFPNPVFNELWTNFSERMDFTIINLKGKTIKRGHTSNTFSVNLEGLPAGTYVISFEYGSRKKAFKFIKM